MQENKRRLFSEHGLQRFHSTSIDLVLVQSPCLRNFFTTIGHLNSYTWKSAGRGAGSPARVEYLKPWFHVKIKFLNNFKMF